MRIWQTIGNWFANLFPRITKYRIEEHVLQTMRELALQTHPKEVIGMLHGRHEGNELIVDSIVFQPFVNSRMSATIHIDSALTGTVGTFHSHPGASSRPSAVDLRLFNQRAGIHGIIAEPYTVLHVYDTRGRLLGEHPIMGDPRAVLRVRRVR